VFLFNSHKHAVLHELTSSTTHRVVRICSQIPAIKTTGSNASTLVELSLLPMKRMMVVALLSTTNRAVLSTTLVATVTDSRIESDSASRLSSSYLPHKHVKLQLPARARARASRTRAP